MLVAAGALLTAHSGPPFPIVSDRVDGAYVVSIWTDPDTTDDGSAGGQFWIRLSMTNRRDVPVGTTATVAVRPLSRAGEPRSAPAAPVRDDITNQFAALILDHEGPFAVRVAIDGPAGHVGIESSVDATYDLRPPPVLLLVYLVPFLLVGGLWIRVLRARRREM